MTNKILNINDIYQKNEFVTNTFLCFYFFSARIGVPEKNAQSTETHVVNFYLTWETFKIITNTHFILLH